MNSQHGRHCRRCGVGITGLALGLVFLTACSGPGSEGSPAGDSPPSVGSQSLGIIRISVTGLGTQNPTATAENVLPNTPVAAKAAEALTAQPCFIQVETPAISSGAFSLNGEQYVSFTFGVRNAQGESYTSGSTKCTTDTANTSTISNVSLLGIVEPGYAIDNTPFLSLKDFDGNNVKASVAASILPTHGMVFNADTNTVSVALGQESLQVFTESQIASLSADPDDVSGTYLVPYGYVVRNVNPALGRTLQANPASGEYDGQFTYAVKLPTSADNVFSFTVDLQAVTDSVTKVTQSVEEQTPLGDIAANLRAINLDSTNLVALGGTHVTSTNIGDPICTVRIAGPASSPSGYLVQNSTADVASVPYNTAGLSPTGSINAGFCQPMTTPSGIYSQFAVSGSQSGAKPNSAYGSFAGSGTTVISFTPAATHPFFPGEQVNYTLTSNLVSSSSKNPAPFTGSFTVGGLVASAGQFVPVSTTAVGTTAESVVVYDFNGDGIEDLAIANYQYNDYGTVNVLLGNGDGTYHPAGSSPAAYPVGIEGGTYPVSITEADFNGDGIADLAVVNLYASDSNTSNGTVAILIGDGKGNFTQPNAAITLEYEPLAVAVGDFKGDGNAVDLAVTNTCASSSSCTDGTVSILINKRDGSGAFTAASGSPITVGNSPETVVVGDFNGDGKTDLAVVNSNDGVANNMPGSVSILLRNGLGTFSQPSGSPFATGDNPRGIAVSDFNGDGKPDLVVTNSPGDTLSVLLNKADGSGTFNGATSVAAGQVQDPEYVATGDFNGDGHVDLAVTNGGSSSGGYVSILLGSGSGTFTPASDSPIILAKALAIASADLNGDGRADLVVTIGDSVDVLLGGGNGIFSTPIPPAYSAETISVGVDSLPKTLIAADFNGDGLLDVAVVNDIGGGTVLVFLAQANGGYVAASGSPYSVGNYPDALIAADFNGDGHPDLAVVNTYASGSTSGNGTVSILTNNGSGSFTVASSSPAVGSFPESIAAGDFNGDGAIDLIVANSNSGNASLLLGTGSGGFAAPTTIPNLGSDPESVAVGDFNSDGKLDFAVVSTLLVMLGNGSGGFTAAPASPNLIVGAGSFVTTADFNGDGKPDLLVLAPEDGEANDYNTAAILLGNGDGSFSLGAGSPFYVGNEPIADAVGDFNGDGLVDLAVTLQGSNSVSILLGNGVGGVTTPGNSSVYVGRYPYGVVAGDFFGTHKLGLAVANYFDATFAVLPQK